MRSLARRTKYCKTHPSYGLKRAPNGSCKACWKAWRQKNQAYTAMARAASLLSALYQADTVEIRADFKGTRGGISAVRLVSMP